MMRFTRHSRIPISSFCLLLFALHQTVQGFAFCLLFSSPAVMPASSDVKEGVEAGVVQLLAIGPGAGDRKQECAATGFLVNGDGYILTNAHVVEDARRCLASSPGGKILAKFGPGKGRTSEALACDVVALDDEHDLAVLKTEQPLPPEHRDASVRLDPGPVPDGARVTVTGHPSFLWKPKTYTGRVVARESLRLGERNHEPTDVLVLNITMQRGASGSPVYLESGEVVGIVERQRPSNRLETVAIPIAKAIALLNRLGVVWTPASVSPNLLSE